MDPYLLLLYIGLALLVGFIFGKLAERINIPEITGYIVAGLIIGPNGLKLIEEGAMGGLHVLTNVVLAIIAYQIGTELWFPKLKKSGFKIVIIVLVHSILVAGIVGFGVFAITQEKWLAFALAGMSVASAPAPIMVIIRKLKAKGIITQTVMPVVGIIDIVAVIMFGLLSSIAVSTLSGSAISFENAFITPFTEVILSIIVGAVLGIVMGLASKIVLSKYPKKDQYIAYLSFAVSLIMASVYIAHQFHLSMILVPLTLGMVFTNFIGKETFDVQTAALNNFGGPFIILFFTVAGLELSLDIIFNAGLVAVAFIALRAIGKIFGTMLGAYIAKADPKVTRYLGFTLLPQGGVTIGMLVAMSAILPVDEARVIQAIILTSILVFEVFGPIIFKRTIEVAGESREHIPTITTRA